MSKTELLNLMRDFVSEVYYKQMLNGDGDADAELRVKAERLLWIYDNTMINITAKE